MTIVISGATGHLGRLVVEALLENNVPAEQIAAGGRGLAQLDAFAARGVQIRAINYNNPASLLQRHRGQGRGPARVRCAGTLRPGPGRQRSRDRLR